MALTGERTVPGLAEENYWFRRHEVVYRRLVDRCLDRDGPATVAGERGRGIVEPHQGAQVDHHVEGHGPGS